jgi:hypothetical protein
MGHASMASTLSKLLASRFIPNDSATRPPADDDVIEKPVSREPVSPANSNIKFNRARELKDVRPVPGEIGRLR